jgi:hypothetical protein
MITTFEPDTHTYRNADGKPVPSVTQLLHQYGLIPPLPPEAQAAQERKRHLGNEVHAATACIDRGERTVVDAETRPYVDAYIAFRRVCQFVPDKIEVPYVGKLCGIEVGMRPDRTGTLVKSPWATAIEPREPAVRGREPIIFDLKCIASEKPHWKLQLAGYALLLSQPLVHPYRWSRLVLQLTPENATPFRLRRYGEQADLDAFRAIAILEAWRRAHG